MNMEITGQRGRRIQAEKVEMAVELGRNLIRQNWAQAEWATGLSPEKLRTADAFPCAEHPKNRNR